MQRLIANFSGRAQRRTENGRSWLVAPVSMIVPGVLAGSKGPLHYPSDMVARNAGRWSGIPLTLGHPSDVVTNAPLSASDRGVVDRLGLGVVRNDKFIGGKHRAEAWFDEEKTKKLAPSVYNALIEGRPMEVSTGLFTQEIERSGVTNGRSYEREVTGYTPDHLAILPDQTGACSVRDGCGLNVHNAAMTQNDVSSGWVTLPNGAHIQLKDGEIVKGPKIDKKEGAEEHRGDAIPEHVMAMFKKGQKGEASKREPMSKSESKEVRKAYGFDKKTWKKMALFPGMQEAHRDLYKEGHKEQAREILKKSPNLGAALRNAYVGPDYGEAEEAQFISINSVCPCGGTCKSCATLNATGMPAIPHPADNSAGSSPATPPPSSAPKSDVGMASPPPPAATSSGLGPTISQPPSPASPPPTTRTGGMATPPALAANDHADPDSECPCGGDCKNCKDRTENANPEGCNQYKECGSGGGGNDSPHSINEEAGVLAREVIRLAEQDKPLTDAHYAKAKQIEERNNAVVDKLRGVQLKEQYEKVFPGMKGRNVAPKSMKEWLKRNVRDRLGSAMRTNNGAACSCGGTCNECKTKMVENDCPAAAGEEKGENADSTPESQPRCPIKQTFQPRGFKGKGRGEAHTAAKQGMADAGNPTTNSLNDDRSSAGHSNNGGSVMDRKQMITHLTTNCDCYKGKAGAVLNNMTDEQLSELITNAQAIAEIRGLNPQFAGLTTNAMPAALKAAMDKKAGEKAGDSADDAEPDDDEDDDEAVPVMKGKAPPTGNVRTTEQWLKTAPADVQRLVRNSLARERKEKEQLIDVLVANVSNGPAKAALVANYLKMDVELLKAQVDSLPTNNASFDGGLDVPAPNYFGAGFGGNVPTANRFSNDAGLEVGALGLPTTATKN